VGAAAVRRYDTAKRRAVLDVCRKLLADSIYRDLHVADIAGPARVSDRGCRTILQQAHEEGEIYWRAGRGRGAFSRLGRAARPAQKLPVIAAAGASRAIEGVKPQIKTFNPKIKSTVVEERSAHHDRRAEDRHREEQERLRLEAYQATRELAPLLDGWDAKSDVSLARTFLDAELPVDPGVADYLAAKIVGEPGLTKIPPSAAYVIGIIRNLAAGQGVVPRSFCVWGDYGSVDEANARYWKEQAA
jgi:hypothetical protein